MTEFTINLPFKGQFNDRIDGRYGHSGGYLEAPAGGMVYGSLGRVKRELRKAAEKYLRRCEANIRNREKQLIVCNDGTVLLIHYHDGWEYSIANKDRMGAYAGSCLTGDSFDDCKARARSHAEQSYGGIAWESTL